MSILTEEEKIAKYDAERAGTIYTLAPAAQPASLEEQFAVVIRDRSLTPQEIGQRCADIAIAAKLAKPERNPFEPFGQLSDGTLIEGHTDDMDPTGRAGVVSANVGDFRITAQDRPNLIGIQGDAYCIDEGPIERLHALRDFLNTPFLDELLASAVAYGRGDAPPMLRVPEQDLVIDHIDGMPVLARYMADEPDDPDYGGLGWAKLTWQGVEISTDGDSYFNLPTSGGMYGDMALAEWTAIKALAHTNIPERLIAIAKRYPTYWDTLTPTPPTTPTITVGYMYHDPDEDGDLAEKSVGALAWVDYECGEGDARARISFGAGEEQGQISTAFAGYSDVSLEDIERSIVNMQALLNDPRVQAARKA